MSTSFWYVFLGVAIPIILLAYMSTAEDADNSSLLLWLWGAGIFLVALVAAPIFALLGKSEIAKGILAALGAGFVALALSSDNIKDIDPFGSTGLVPQTLDRLVEWAWPATDLVILYHYDNDIFLQLLLLS